MRQEKKDLRGEGEAVCEPIRDRKEGGLGFHTRVESREHKSKVKCRYRNKPASRRCPGIYSAFVS